MNDMEKQCITRKNEIKEMNEMGGGSSAEVRRENRRKVKELKRRKKKYKGFTIEKHTSHNEQLAKEGETEVC